MSVDDENAWCAIWLKCLREPGRLSLWNLPSSFSWWNVDWKWLTRDVKPCWAVLAPVVAVPEGQLVARSWRRMHGNVAFEGGARTGYRIYVPVLRSLLPAIQLKRFTHPDLGEILCLATVFLCIYIYMNTIICSLAPPPPLHVLSILLWSVLHLWSLCWWGGGVCVYVGGWGGGGGVSPFFCGVFQTCVECVLGDILSIILWSVPNMWSLC